MQGFYKGFFSLFFKNLLTFQVRRQGVLLNYLYDPQFLIVEVGLMVTVKCKWQGTVIEEESQLHEMKCATDGRIVG